MGHLDRALVSRKVSPGYGRRWRSASRHKPFIAHVLRGVSIFQWENRFMISFKRHSEPSDEIMKISKYSSQRRVFYLWSPLYWIVIKIHATCYLFCALLNTEQSTSFVMNHKSKPLGWKTMPSFLVHVFSLSNPILPLQIFVKLWPDYRHGFWMWVVKSWSISPSSCDGLTDQAHQNLGDLWNSQNVSKRKLLNVCLSNEHMPLEDVVPSETQLSITASLCSVSAWPLAWRNTHFTHLWSSSSLIQMKTCPGGFIPLAGDALVTGLSPPSVTPLWNLFWHL